MKRVEAPTLGGLALIVAGLFFLLLNLGLLGPMQSLVWAIFFAAGGIVCLAGFIIERRRWWMLIPGCTLLGLGALVGAGELAPRFADAWGGTLFLGAISLGFWLIALTAHERWWAIIPGGLLTTLAVVAGAAPQVEGNGAGAVLFLGMALTFGLVGILPGGQQRRWAFIPAAILGLMGLVLFASLENLLALIWPAALILGGALIVFRALRQRDHPAPR